jgi:hypothetical protein
MVKSAQFNPDCAVVSYCDLKILAATLVSRFLPATGRLLLDIFINMPPSQNRSNCAFRFGFLRLATDSTAQSGLNHPTPNHLLHPKIPFIEVFFPRHRLRVLRKCLNAPPFGRGVSLILRSGFLYIWAYYFL